MTSSAAQPRNPPPRPVGHTSPPAPPPAPHFTSARITLAPTTHDGLLAVASAIERLATAIEAAVAARSER